MDREALLVILKQLIALGEEGTTTFDGGPVRLDAARYCDPARAERERDRLFLHYPQVAGMSCDLAPGAYAAETVAGVPVLLLRDEGGTFRAFLNACRHRGTMLAEGCGSAKRFTCPWHAWSYDQTGRLVSVPHPDGFEGIEKETHGLVALPAEERHGLLFVGLTPGEDLDLDNALGDLGAELGSFHFEQLHRTDVRHTDFALNWKLANDTGFEVYHVSFLHKDSVGPLNIGNTAVYERFGPNHRMSIVSPSALELRDQPETDWQPLDHMQLIYNIFPSTGMVVSPVMVALTRTDPGPTPSTCRFRFSTYSWVPLDDPGMGEFATMAFEGLYSVVNTEDFVVAARTQANIDAGSVEHVLVGGNEPAVRWSHEAYDRFIGEG